VVAEFLSGGAILEIGVEGGWDITRFFKGALLFGLSKGFIGHRVPFFEFWLSHFTPRKPGAAFYCQPHGSRRLSKGVDFKAATLLPSPVSPHPPII
jgi:hypothetical protein